MCLLVTQCLQNFPAKLIPLPLAVLLLSFGLLSLILINMGNLTKNFSKYEFACKCGCGFDDINFNVVLICQSIRDFLNVPIHINSGCRCEKHNKSVGGVQNSYHSLGLAADLSCPLGANAIFEAAKNLFRQGKIPTLRYCILYKNKNFVHIDCGKHRNNTFEVRT